MFTLVRHPSLAPTATEQPPGAGRGRTRAWSGVLRDFRRAGHRTRFHSAPRRLLAVTTPVAGQEKGSFTTDWLPAPTVVSEAPRAFQTSTFTVPPARSPSAPVADSSWLAWV
jgi:hypothetical protein